MKSFGGKATTNRLKAECEKYVEEHLDEIRYELFKEIVQDDFRQAEAGMLWMLSLHGYKEKRLKLLHKWFKQLTEFPELNGKPCTFTDCMKLLNEKYGIDFDEVKVKFESKESYNRRQT